MTLPAAGPGTVILGINLLDECWADVLEPSGFFHQCRGKVDEFDDLGLCIRHREELTRG